VGKHPDRTSGVRFWTLASRRGGGDRFLPSGGAGITLTEVE